MRTLAIILAAAMLLLLFEPSVVVASSEQPAPTGEASQPVVSSSIPEDPTNATNETRPAPPSPSPGPGDLPQRPVGAGSIAQGWGDVGSVSLVAEQRDATLFDDENKSTIETSYGYFVLRKDAPYFVRVLSPDGSAKRVGDSAFLVLFNGRLLRPSNGTGVGLSDALSFHYDLHLNGTVIGKMTVVYLFSARYQDPVVMRFIQRDPLGPGYNYAVNNPISFIDPSGMYTILGKMYNFLTSDTGQAVLLLVTAALAIALAIPTGGVSALVFLLASGVVVGTIFVAYTYVASGGKATAEDYFGAFLLGFVIGVSIADVALQFYTIGRAVLAAARVSRVVRGLAEEEVALARGAQVEQRIASGERMAVSAQRAADGDLVWGTHRGQQGWGRIIDGEFVPNISGGAPTGTTTAELDFARRLGGGPENLNRPITVGGRTYAPDYLDDSIIGETTMCRGLSARKMVQIDAYMQYAAGTGRSVVIEMRSLSNFRWISAKAAQYEVTTWILTDLAVVLA